MTNWDTYNIFSRVFPIFTKGKQNAQNNQKINAVENKINFNSIHLRLPGYEELLKASNNSESLSKLYLDKRGNIVEDSVKNTERNQKRIFNRNKELNVTFYPESGSLVRGLQSRVAFEIEQGDSVQEVAIAFLLNNHGDTLAAVHTIREGRGIFTCLPDSGKLVLGVPNSKKKGLIYFPLPQVKEEGCTLTLQDQTKDSLMVEMEATKTFAKQLLGLSLQRNGQVYYFDTLTIGKDAVLMPFVRSNLPAGVSQITLFNSEGRILAERLFFIPPREEDTPKIKVTSTVQTISPCAKLALDLKSEAGSSISLSVVDNATIFNDGNHENYLSYLLLSSDLKGYINRPDYYFESDDAEHRLAADLLTMVQGWRKYDWMVMSGQETFHEKEPQEKELFLDGKLQPQPKFGIANLLSKKETQSDLAHVFLKATLYNENGDCLKGTAVSNAAGYYALKIPNCDGEWTLIINAIKNGKPINCNMTIDRWFSPELRLLSFREIMLKQPEIEKSFNLDYHPLDTLHLKPKETQKDILLGKVFVKTKKTNTLHKSWIGEDILKKADNFISYDCDAITEKMKDNGEQIPGVYEWMKKKEYFKKQVFEKGNASLWADDMRESFQTNTRSLGMEYDAPEIIPDLSLDDIRTMYVMINRETDPLDVALFGEWPVTILMYLHKFVDIKSKGIRKTYFKAYNVPETFQMNNYDLLPPEEDFRRTLYWNPDIKIGKDGKTKVEFWNNSTCKQFTVSAEGITPNGKPICN